MMEDILSSTAPWVWDIFENITEVAFFSPLTCSQFWVKANMNNMTHLSEQVALFASRMKNLGT